MCETEVIDSPPFSWTASFVLRLSNRKVISDQVKFT